MTFFSDPDPRNFGAGSSIINWETIKITGKRKKEMARNAALLYGNMTKITVQSLDLASYVNNIMKIHSPEVAVMKIDIEGSEYHVVPHMLRLGAFCYIDLVFFEFHPKLFAVVNKHGIF